MCQSSKITIMKTIEIIVATRAASHSLSVRRVSGRPVSRSSSSLLPQATMRSIKVKETISIARRALDVHTRALSKFLHPPMQHYCLHRDYHSLNPHRKHPGFYLRPNNGGMVDNWWKRRARTMKE